MRHPHLPIALLLATLTAAVPLTAEPVRLVADLDTQADPIFSGSPEPFAVFDGALYFWSTDPVTGTEPWKSDGTPEGTAPLKDVCPGRCGSRSPFSEAAVAGGRLFFTACDGARGCQLWTTDGTARGTRLVDAFPGNDEPVPVPTARHLTPWHGALYFAVAAALYRTDGTPAGTVLVKDLRSDDERVIARIVAAEDRLFVSTLGELWTSDGTEAGTRRLLELPEDRYSGFLQTAAGSRLFYTTRDTSLENELWTSDGTAAGTIKLRDATGSISGLVPVGGKVLFFDNSNRVELWTTDGTAAGTKRVRSGLSNHAEPLAVLGDDLYFANLSTLWRSDGTAAGTRVANRFRDAVVDLRVAGGALYALTWSLGETAVWRTLGTAATTERVLGGAAGRFEEAFPFGDRLALPVERDGQGEELALLAPGTGDLTFLTDAVDPGSGNPTSLTGDGSRLLFVASGGVHATRGTAAATELLAPFSPDARLVRTDGGGTFVFDDGLWLVDAAGTPALLLAESDGTRIDAELSVVVGAELVFLVLEPYVDTYTLWRSDGTPAGTTAAATGIPPNYFCYDPPCIPVSVELTALADEIFIVHQTRLLRADLSRKTVTTVFDAEELEGCHDLLVDGTFCQVENATAAGGRLFFTTAGTDEPLVLWASDGTAAGTSRVRELLPPPIYVPAPIRELTAAGGKLFFTFPDPELGEELWASDGTAAGTAVVRDVRPGPRSSFPRGLTAFDGRLVFAADDGAAGHEPWTSDGTAAGTARVADVCPGRCSSLPRGFAAVGGLLVFAADDGVAGAEPWRSDLTAEGTWRIDDVSPGPSPSGPRDFTEADRGVYFNAATAATGFELYTVPRVALRDPTEPCPDCLVDGRFRVRVDWVDPQGIRGAGTAINGRYWFFYGGLSNVGYTITVTDTETGASRVYRNAAGELCGRGDTTAF